MSICFHDELGIVVVRIDMTHTTGVAFDGKYAYFTDIDGRDYKIEAKQIVLIGDVAL